MKIYDFKFILIKTINMIFFFNIQCYVFKAQIELC